MQRAMTSRSGTSGRTALALLALVIAGGCHHHHLKHVMAALRAEGAAVADAGSDMPGLETIVLIRHGEKPPEGLGQLTCQGLNRALALPRVIAARFGKPDAIFAMSPTPPRFAPDLPFDFVRPLVTIEPTAIRFGLQVNANIGFGNPERLVATLDRPAYRNALVLVAWEHREIGPIAGALLSSHGGGAGPSASWPASDFDSIYVVRIKRMPKQRASATFEREREGLDGQSTTCPG